MPIMTVQEVTRDQIKDIAEYEKVRAAWRKEIIKLKKRRRVSVGSNLTFLFENPETVRFQVQEMMRAERIVHDDAIQRELDVYNQLLPSEDNELAATMFIEITDQDMVKEVLDSLMGIDNGDYVFMTIGDSKVPANFESGHSSDIKLSAVHYVRFKLTPEQAKAFCDVTQEVVLVAAHPNYRAIEVISKEARHALIEDLS